MIIRNTIKKSDDNKIIKFSLSNTNNLLGLDQDVSNLIIEVRSYKFEIFTTSHIFSKTPSLPLIVEMVFSYLKINIHTFGSNFSNS